MAKIVQLYVGKGNYDGCGRCALTDGSNHCRQFTLLDGTRLPGTLPGEGCPVGDTAVFRIAPMGREVKDVYAIGVLENES